ncbi:MAG: hypothetical protein IKB25_11000 [Lentisphaeria bacterium]|nr:hypothetical protein [Lentisphaeria bacterium]
MKLTDEIVKALNKCINEGYSSVQEFARLTNISADTLAKYLKKETQAIKEETWMKMYPLLKPYLKHSNNRPAFTGTNKMPELETDERILLDAFNDLPEKVRKEKLMEILELARKYNLEDNVSIELDLP